MILADGPIERLESYTTIKLTGKQQLILQELRRLEALWG